MKTITAIMMLFLSFALCAAASAEKKQEGGDIDRSLERIKAKATIVIGLDDAFPPMGFREKGSNEIIGFDIDLARKAAERLGLTIVPKTVRWSRIIPALNSGDVDVIWNGLSIAPERQQQMIFSKPYLENRQTIVVKSGSKIRRKIDLAGKKVGHQFGSSSERALRADPKTVNTLTEISAYPDNQRALDDLAAGRIDAVVMDEVAARYVISRKEGVFVMLADNFGREYYGVGFRKGDAAFRDAIDRVLEEMKKDGTADAIAKKWFGEKTIVK
jgi:polar amino acid transport system substrate-binding protein